MHFYFIPDSYIIGHDGSGIDKTVTRHDFFGEWYVTHIDEPVRQEVSGLPISELYY